MLHIIDAQHTVNTDRIEKLKAALDGEKDGALAYDDKLVRDFIEKIEVLPDMMRFTMKARMVTEVKM